jgi:hypothetical protein
MWLDETDSPEATESDANTPTPIDWAVMPSPMPERCEEVREASARPGKAAWAVMLLYGQAAAEFLPAVRWAGRP